MQTNDELHKETQLSYDIENESLDNSNDSITVPRYSILSTVSMDSPPDLKMSTTKNAAKVGKNLRIDDAYSPPWIKK